jgi:linoleoyl-CoA desaturase
MISKILTGTLWWLLSYIAIFLFSTNQWEFLLLYLFHGLGHIYFSFNVGHDALHNAISKNKAVNKFWSYSYDLLGVNTYMWRFMHHRGHHACINIEGKDMSLETSGIFRLSNGEPRKKIHRYQHIYAFFVYGLYLFYYVFVKDFKYFFSKNNIHLKKVKHPKSEWAKLFAGKTFYLLYMLIIPLYVLPFHWSIVLLAFSLTLFMIGVVMSFTFQTTHIVDSTHYPANRNEYENYVFHVFETTADYAATNPVANWFFGGLNVHVIHHLRSDICHTHYPALTKIVKTTAAEYGVNYRENQTVLSAVKAHLRQLKKLGNS